MQVSLKISGMSCGNCVRHVNGALAKSPGVSDAKVEVGHAKLQLDPSKGTIDAILAALREEGYPAELET